MYLYRLTAGTNKMFSFHCQHDVTTHACGPRFSVTRVLSTRYIALGGGPEIRPPTQAVIRS